MEDDSRSELDQSQPRPRIFISGAIEGFRPERQQAKTDLQELDLDPWVFEAKPASSQPLRDSYLEYVRDSERVVWVIDGPPPDAVVEEIREALLFDIPVLAFVLGELDPKADELVRATGGKYAQVNRGNLVEEIRAAVVGEQRRGMRRPRMGRAAVKPPAPPADFVGRSAELAALVTALSEKRHVIVNGLPGVGKSALALAAAATVEADLVLYLDLRSADRPAPSEHSLRRLLSGAGYPNKVIPSTGVELENAWREATERRRIVVVIDDVVSEDEVRFLLPAGDGAALITARHTLPGLVTVEQFSLGELSQGEALEFMTKVLGAQRVAAEREAGMELHLLTGGLPLALRITAARLATRAHWELAEYVRRLRDERKRLEELEAGDVTVRASFNLSYSLLEDHEAKAFRAVGFFRGPQFAASALASAVEFDADAALEGVVDAQLLTSLGGQQYEIHDLLRLFAGEQLVAEGPGVRRAGAARLAEYYRVQAVVRHLAILGHNVKDVPLTWLDRETANLHFLCEQLAELGLDRELADLILDAGMLYGVAQAWRSWDAVLELAEGAAERLDDERLKTKITLNRGIAAFSYGDPARATVLLKQAEQAAKDAGDRGDEARAIAQQATVLKNNGDPAAARVLTERALELYREDDDQLGVARALGDLASQTDALGDHEGAIELHGQSMEAFRRVPDVSGLAIEHGNTGIALMRLERYDEAEARFAAAEEIHERLGARWYLAEVAGRRGELAARRGDLAAALEYFDRAVGGFETLDDARMLAAELGMRAGVRRGLGDANAIDDAQRALAIAEELGDEFEIAVAVARVVSMGDRLDEQAFIALERAHVIFGHFRGHPHPAAAMTATQLALIARAGGQLVRARSLLKQAVDIARAAHDRSGHRVALSNLARLEAEMGEAEQARASLEAFRQYATDSSEEEHVRAIERLIASEVVVSGAGDELAARLACNVRTALEELEWEVRTVRIVVAGPDRLATGTNVNETEIMISRKLLPEHPLSDPPAAAIQEQRLRFLVSGVVATHVLMVMGVQSHADTGSSLIETGSAWFARHMTPKEAWPRLEADVDATDPFLSGAYLGAAYAGDQAALAALRAEAPDLVRPGEFEHAQAEWDRMAPIDLLRQLAAGYQQLRNQQADTYDR